MTDPQIDFAQIRWNNNRFRVVERTKSSLCIVVADLTIQNELPRTMKLMFKNPASEWAMLWDTKTEEWKEHPDSENPIGSAIVEAIVKPIGLKHKFSFGGNHKFGWSRWGFSADSCQLKQGRIKEWLTLRMC